MGRVQKRIILKTSEVCGQNNEWWIETEINEAVVNNFTNARTQGRKAKTPNNNSRTAISLTGHTFKRFMMANYAEAFLAEESFR
jgi:hypothetical protein